ncbi:MAG: hypothetical protein OXI88_19765 [Gammaproteobacteria bacterium]|nr:hypothetical protein [Gammaproteobacteria bacterium]
MGFLSKYVNDLFDISILLWLEDWISKVIPEHWPAHISLIVVIVLVLARIIYAKRKTWLSFLYKPPGESSLQPEFDHADVNNRPKGLSEVLFRGELAQLIVTVLFVYLLVLALLGSCEVRMYGGQWTHPSLSESERQQVENECRMKAFEAISSADNPYMSTEIRHERQDYINACMENQGFIRQKVES